MNPTEFKEALEQLAQGESRNLVRSFLDSCKKNVLCRAVSSDSCQKNVGEIQGSLRAVSSRRVKKSRQIVFGQSSEKCLI